MSRLRWQTCLESGIPPHGWGEQDQFSMVVDPATGKALLYDAIEDPLQRHDISAAHREVVSALKVHAEDERQLTDYLLAANLIWQEPR